MSTSARAWVQPALVGCVTAFVGFASSFAVVLNGLRGVGASEAEAASGLMAAAVAMGLAGIVLSLMLRQPVSSAWSTPGAALLASTGAAAGGFPAAVGAFLVANALLVAAALVRPLGRAVAAIPGSLANAMLAGVLFNLCLAPVKSAVAAPGATAIVVVVWLVMLRLKRIYATPAAALAAAVVIAWQAPNFAHGSIAPAPVLVWPRFTAEAFASLALPLFLVTMASQNLPGLAVLKTYGYAPSPTLSIGVTGAFGVLAAPLGSHAVNLSAITAALCASPDASPDRDKRWIASAVTGAVYVLFGVSAGAVTRMAAAAPLLVEAVAGLALIGALGVSLYNALSETQERDAALATFLVAASGFSFHGIGAAFWGLVAGGAMLLVTRAGAWPPRRDRPA
jgi:benzoate membrane transport protein